MNGVGLSFVALHAMVHLDFVVAFAAYARRVTNIRDYVS